ncbi:MAG: UDP-3-O-(3-hydroxymyristoyl)glucosamine N-acyltransferase [Campylobacteraceae bacterium]|nr:UDP-3-O-(3-hydroxymyristoyl)glucosamine N-acyltransferase [Campylobacteraceae bacterium]
MLLSELALIANATLEGVDKDIKALNSLVNASSLEVSYIDNPRHKVALESTKAGAVFITKNLIPSLPKNSIALVCENPQLAFAKASAYFAPNLARLEGNPAFIDESATIFPGSYIGKGAQIGANVTIMANAYIGDEVTIDEGSIIHPGAVVYPRSKLGKRCHILANAVIGSDGFGYAHTAKGEHIKIYHMGNVVLEDDVEVGACSTIDRGVFGSTTIKQGTKIDNLVQIGHNCELGENCIIVSQVGLSGSSMLGKNVTMGGQSATSGHLYIGDFATIAARGGVSKSLEGEKIYGGFPILLQKDWLKLQAKILRFFIKK